MRFLLLLGCVLVTAATHRNQAEPRADSKDKASVLDERSKRPAAEGGIKTKPKITRRPGVFSSISQITIQRDKRDANKRKPPGCVGCYTSLLMKDENTLSRSTSSLQRGKRAAVAIKPTKKPFRPGIYGPIRVQRDTEDAEKQSKRQKHLKKRRRGEKRREWKKKNKGDYYFHPQVEDSETMRDHRGPRGYHRREDWPLRKPSPGLFSPLGRAKAENRDRIHEKDTEVEDSETLGDGRGHCRHHRREDKPRRKPSPGLYSRLCSHRAENRDRTQESDTEVEVSETTSDIGDHRTSRHTEERCKHFLPGCKGPLFAGLPMERKRIHQSDTQE